jgi:4-amino-4-deoxy-L-arabinose transferase-like glycosyltransferase
LIARVWGVIPIALAIVLFAVRACIHVPAVDRMAASPSLTEDPPKSRAHTATLWVPRGGPMIIGFQSDGPARLTIASKDIRGAGVIKDRIIVDAGPLPIRFAGPPNARLMWSPPGRRGDMEYLPPSSLSPEPPETATYSYPGTNIADGVIALLLLLVLVGSLLMLARARLAAVPRGTWWSFGSVLAVALLARLIGLGDQGQTWDEDVNWASGRNYITNVLALDFSDRAWIWNYEHPPVMKLLDGIGAQLADGFGPARALSALWVSLGCALLVPIGARLFRLRVGVLAAMIAALLPPLVAHGQIVGHESPTVLWWSLGVLLSLGVHDRLPDDNRRAALRSIILRMVAVGAVVGIAISSRFVNGLLGPLCVLIIIVRAPAAWRQDTVKWIAITAVTAVVVFLAVWPRMWGQPLAHLNDSLKKLKGLHPAEPFLGKLTNVPGPHYFLVYLYATAPFGVLLATVGGLVRVGKQRTASLWIVVAWFVIPLAVIASPVRQDGVRYVMPCVIAVALLAAVGIDWLATALESRIRRAFPVLAGLVALYLAITLARTYPYYLDYFGEHVGGAGSVQKRRMLETAWWGEGLDRAIAYVNEHAPQNAAIEPECVLPGHLTWYRQDLWANITRSPRAADFIVWYSPAVMPCTVPETFHEVFSVTHDGADLVRVYSKISTPR